jgi:small subunit ribosomal protein S7
MQFSKYSHYFIRKFLNHLMKKGKKEKAEKILASAFSEIQENQKKDPLLIFLKAMERLRPLVEVRPVRRGGATYQIPVPCFEKRGISLSMKWILENARKKKAVLLSQSLGSALLESSKGLGEGEKKKDFFHATALKNRSFTHFRWF